MTVLDTRITVARLHRPPRTRTVPAPADPHTRLLAGLNRLLKTESTTQMDGFDAFAGLCGALANLAPRGMAFSELDLAKVVERTADGLGCPPVPSSRGWLLRWLRGAR